MSDKKQTITYFNIIKTISIFLVVFCHVTLLKNKGYVDNFAMLFCWAGVPCFLMVNGALLFNKELKLKKHIKKTIMIYIANIIWRLIYIIVYNKILKENVDLQNKSMVFKYLFCFGNLKGVYIGHFYFIEALLSCYLIFPVLYQSYQTKEGKKCLITFGIIIFLLVYGINAINFVTKLIIQSDKLNISGLKVILPFNGYAQYMLFFIIGGFLHTYREKIQNIKHIKIISTSIVLISLIGLAMIRYTDTKTFQWNWVLLSNGYGRMCTLVMSIALFILLQNTEIKNKIFKKCIDAVGYNTLSIFYIHMPILAILNKYVYEHITVRGVTVNILKTVFVIAIIQCVSILLKKIPIVNKIL